MHEFLIKLQYTNDVDMLFWFETFIVKGGALWPLIHWPAPRPLEIALIILRTLQEHHM